MDIDTGTGSGPLVKAGPLFFRVRGGSRSSLAGLGSGPGVER